MNLRLVVPPSVEPLLLEEAKAQLRVTHSAEDDLIMSYLAAARQRCENYQLRSYMPQTWELTLRSFPGCCDRNPDGAIVLPRPPILRIESVKYTSSAGVLTTLDPAAYELESGAEPGRLIAVYGTAWPTARAGRSAVRVRYVAGYEAVPEVVKQAIRFELGSFSANRENEVAGTITTELKGGTKALLRPDRVPAGLYR